MLGSSSPSLHHEIQQRIQHSVIEQKAHGFCQQIRWFLAL
jgi:hypothetical protein